MNRKKARAYPPIVVSAVVVVIMFGLAFGTISGGVTANPELEPVVLAEVTTEQTEQPVAEATIQPEELSQPIEVEQEDAEEPEPEPTYESMIQSRDWDAEDAERLMKIAMAEAEGESVEGKALVMLVVLNRVWSDDFPGTIYEVIFQPGQFSPTVQGGRYWTTEPDEGCYEALELVMSGWDESYGALYFESCQNSSWQSENLEFLFQEGNHRFYK